MLRNGLTVRVKLDDIRWCQCLGWCVDSGHVVRNGLKPKGSLTGDVSE